MAKKPTPVSKVVKTTTAPTEERDPILASKEEQERIAVAFRNRIDGFQLEKCYMIAEGPLVNQFRPVAELQFEIYRNARLWTLALKYDGQILGIARHAGDTAGVHDLVITSALKAYLLGREDIAQFILGNFIDSLLRYQAGFIHLELYDYEINFTDTVETANSKVSENGFMLFRKNGTVIADGFCDDAVRQHISRFGAMYTEYCKHVATILKMKDEKLDYTFSLDRGVFFAAALAK